MVFLEFSTRGPRRAKLKLFPSPARAIIVRNGEIIPMSREFTPETERQRLQLLVSGKKNSHSCSLLSLVPVCTLCPRDCPTPTPLTAPCWEEHWAELVEEAAGRSVGCSGAPTMAPAGKEVESEVWREQQRPLRGNRVESFKHWPWSWTAWDGILVQVPC